MTNATSWIGALCLVTAGLYAPVWTHDFVEFDDALYVSRNPHVRLGLTLETVRWAFASGDAFIWHPLTWLSYLLDATLYGTGRAGPWLLTNVALHVVNTALLFRLLVASMGRPAWVCCVAAAIFALHPIQVEAVAWVSGRKELLAATFLLLTLHAYGRYAARPSGLRYALVTISMAAMFMAKGSHVALPLVLLVLDHWPLGRLVGRTALVRLSLEKLPWLALALASVAVNAALVAKAGNVWVTDPGFFERAGAVP